MSDHFVQTMAVVIFAVGGYLIALLASNALNASRLRRAEVELAGYPVSLELLRKTRFSYLFLKRWVELAVAIFFWLALAPILVFFSILIRVESRGPVLYKWRRLGVDGKRFYTFRFRTLETSNLRRFSNSRETDRVRITRVGHFLRATSFDQLPAFINILKGEMALVGRSSTIEDEAFSKQVPGDIRQALLKIKPGFISFASVYGYWQSLSKDEALQYDLYYALNRSLRLDMSLAFEALLLTFRGASKV